MKQTSRTHPAKQTHNMTPFATEKQMKAQRDKHDATRPKKVVVNDSTPPKPYITQMKWPKDGSQPNIYTSEPRYKAPTLVGTLLNLANRTKNYLKANHERFKKQLNIAKPKW